MKIKKLSADPPTWVRMESDKHKYICIPGANTKRCYYDVFVCDDDNVNNKTFLKTIKGNRLYVAHMLNQMEIEKEQYEKDMQKLEREGF